jgi:hypothetical protein
MSIKKVNYVEVTGVVKNIKHQPATTSHPRSRTMILLQVDRRTTIRVVAADTHAARLSEGAVAKVYGQLGAWVGGLEIRATQVLTGAALEEPLTPAFHLDQESQAAADHSAGRVLGGAKQESQEVRQ